MLKRFRADFHIHTCLSPCGDLGMYPSAIVEKAIDERVDIIGICDHNSAENAGYVLKAAEGRKLKVLPGMEVTSREEVHLLSLFENVEDALKLQEAVYEHLPGENDEDTFGLQVVVDEKGEVLKFNKRLLIGATTLSIEEIVALTHSLDGLSFASHVDRESFSIIGQLGFIPDKLPLDGLEISWRMREQEARERLILRREWRLFCSSDAHSIDEIGRCVALLCLEEMTFEGIKRFFSVR